MPKNNGNPTCPACGSSATLPFESRENAGTEGSFIEVVLIIVFLLLIVFCILLALLLSHATLPAMTLILLSGIMLWRQKKTRRKRRTLPRRFVCLDCSRNFKT